MYVSISTAAKLPQLTTLDELQRSSHFVIIANYAKVSRTEEIVIPSCYEALLSMSLLTWSLEG